MFKAYQHIKYFFSTGSEKKLLWISGSFYLQCHPQLLAGWMFSSYFQFRPLCSHQGHFLSAVTGLQNLKNSAFIGWVILVIGGILWLFFINLFSIFFTFFRFLWKEVLNHKVNTVSDELKHIQSDNSTNTAHITSNIRNKQCLDFKALCLRKWYSMF